MYRRDAGCTVALATDCNPGTSYFESMALVISLAVVQMGLTTQQAIWSAKLPDNDARSRKIVATMRDEEAAHGENAIKAGAAELPKAVKTLMQATAKVMTTTAYRL